MVPPRVLAGKRLGLVNSHEVMIAARENDVICQTFGRSSLASDSHIRNYLI